MLLAATLAGSVVSLAVLMLKNKIVSIFGGKTLYAVSLLAMLIFLLPLHIGELSLPKMPSPQAVQIVKTEPTAATDENTAPQATAPEMPSGAETERNTLPKPSVTLRRSNPVTAREILFVIWFLGVTFALCRYFVSYFKFKRKICNFPTHETIDGVTVIKSPLISSPLVFGFFKPTLAIPAIEMNETDYNLAIKHEMVHYKHHDSLFKLFAVLVNSVHWFNPITYPMVGLIGEACEYACDEQVTRDMDIQGKKQYSEMILSMVCQTSPALSSNMAKSKKQLKRRFEMIMTKKRHSVCKTILCMVVLVILTSGSVVLANEVVPMVSTMLKSDSVYVETFGNGAYNHTVPAEKNGVYYLPLREILNKCDIENDKIKFENDTITVDIWTNELTMVSVVSGPNEPREERRDTTPAAYSWSTSCQIGSREANIDGETCTLSHAPYIEDDITYVPYEYLQKLRLYENKFFGVKTPSQKQTSKFTTMMLFGFDSGKAAFYTDYMQLNYLLGATDFAYVAGDAEAKISKTGYRTEFEASCGYFDINDPAREGTLSVKLNKVTRIYSKGSDIEGLFTVTKDGEVIYDNEKGRITGLPIPAGEGVLDTGITKIQIGELQFDVFWGGLDCISDAYNERAKEVSQAGYSVRKTIIPEAVKLHGIKVRRGSKGYSYLWYNTDKKLIDINIAFDDYDESMDSDSETFRIYTEIDSEPTWIDENTIATKLYICDQSTTRLDSFDAVITMLPNGDFELQSTDGNYIVRGTYEDYVPQWQWSEAQKSAPVPQVTMIGAD